MSGEYRKNVATDEQLAGAFLATCRWVWTHLDRSGRSYYQFDQLFQQVVGYPAKQHAVLAFNNPMDSNLPWASHQELREGLKSLWICSLRDPWLVEIVEYLRATHPVAVEQLEVESHNSSMSLANYYD